MDDLVFEFADPAGDSLRISWDGEALANLDPGARAESPPWALAGELDWDEIAALRMLSARLPDGRLIAIVALRPVAATGHGDEVMTGAVARADGFEGLEQTLLSTEYDAEGLPRRVGLELYPEERGMPMRVAGEVTDTAVAEHGGVRRLSALLTLRSAGMAGVGVLDVLSAAGR